MMKQTAQLANEVHYIQSHTHTLVHTYIPAMYLQEGKLRE